MEMNKQSFSFGSLHRDKRVGRSDSELKKIALTGIDKLPAAASWRLDVRS
jgi:hypothetical protein